MSELAEVIAPANTEVVSSVQPTEQQPDLATLHLQAFGIPMPGAEPKKEDPPPPAETTQIQTDTPDYTPFVKEFGFEKYEDFKSEFESLKALKNQPAPTAEEIKFANDESKRIHEALKAGKNEEVLAYLQAQKMLNGMDSMSVEDKLKLQIKLQNPKFDAELVEDEYNELFGLDESKYEDDPNGLRKAKLRLEQKRENALEQAQDFFAKYKQKIELPEIEKAQAPTDSDYEDYKASTAEMMEVVEKVVKPAILSTKESDVEMRFAVKDDNAQMNFDLGIKVTPEDFERAKANVLDWNGFVSRATSDDKGHFSAKKAYQLVLLAENFDKYAQSIAKQAVNAERKRVLAKETPSSEQRDGTVNMPEETEQDRLHRLAFGFSPRRTA